MILLHIGILILKQRHFNIVEYRYLRLLKISSKIIFNQFDFETIKLSSNCKRILWRMWVFKFESTGHGSGSIFILDPN